MEVRDEQPSMAGSLSHDSNSQQIDPARGAASDVLGHPDRRNVLVVGDARSTDVLGGRSVELHFVLSSAAAAISITVLSSYQIEALQCNTARGL